MPEKKKRILLTNDDGGYSEGLTALASELGKRADLLVVAPDREQSASSHSLTLNRPLRLTEVSDATYTTDGTPTDCVMLAVHMLWKRRKPDMIVSGINHGANMGEDVTYSGTVAAAIEGSIMGIPSIAVSVVDWGPGMPMRRAAAFVGRLVRAYDDLGLKPSTFLNVNLPPDDGNPYRKYQFTRPGIRQYKDIIIRKTDPRGKPYYWIAGQAKWSNRRQSDYDAVRRGIVSISPLQLDFTDVDTLDRLGQLTVKI